MPDIKESVTQIELKRVRPPEWNSRLDITGSKDPAVRAALEELATSMNGDGKTRNQIQPIVVELLDDGNYLLVAGSRRLAAAMLNRWDTIEAKVRAPSSPIARIADNAMENLIRRDLSTYEEARVYAQLRAAGVKTSKIGPMLGVSQQKVSNLGITFEKLAPEVKEEWRLQHPAAVVDFLRELAGKVPAEQLRLWNARIELLRVSEDVLANDVADDDQGDDDGDEEGGKRPRAEAAGAPEPDYRVSRVRYRQLLRALQAARFAGQTMAILSAKYLVGSMDAIEGVIDQEGKVPEKGTKPGRAAKKPNGVRA